FVMKRSVSARRPPRVVTHPPRAEKQLYSSQMFRDERGGSRSPPSRSPFPSRCLGSPLLLPPFACA
ncbi:uncharacterized, partial [Tachysurus ichikawai]